MPLFSPQSRMVEGGWSRMLNVTRHSPAARVVRLLTRCRVLGLSNVARVVAS